MSPYVLPDANRSGTFFSCIWDAGGNDTIRYGGSRDAVIDLRMATLLNAPGGGGYISRAGDVVGGFTIAKGAVIENAIGGRGDDRLTGNASANRLDGGAGADTLVGGSGDDTYIVGNVGDKVVETTNHGHDTVASAVSFSLKSLAVEVLRLTGTGNDGATGNTGANELAGNAGTNRIEGREGNDTLAGGSGDDSFVFATALDGSRNVDTILDFGARTGNDDRFYLSDLVFLDLSKGTLASAQLKNLDVGTVDATDRILYDQESGRLSYDQDGSGVRYAPIAFAEIADGTRLGAADFILV